MQQQIHDLDLARLLRSYRLRQLDPVRVCAHLLASIAVASAET